MGIKEDQEWVKEAWTKGPKQNVTEADELLFLMEEIGEMAEAIRKKRGHKENKPFQEDLEKEMGDVYLSLLTIAIRHGVQLEQSWEKTKRSIIERYV